MASSFPESLHDATMIIIVQSSYERQNCSHEDTAFWSALTTCRASSPTSANAFFFIEGFWNPFQTHDVKRPHTKILCSCFIPGFNHLSPFSRSDFKHVGPLAPFSTPSVQVISACGNAGEWRLALLLLEAMPRAQATRNRCSPKGTWNRGWEHGVLHQVVRNTVSSICISDSIPPSCTMRPPFIAMFCCVKINLLYLLYARCFLHCHNTREMLMSFHRPLFKAPYSIAYLGNWPVAGKRAVRDPFVKCENTASLQRFWGDLSGVPRSSLTTSALAFLGNGGDQGVDVKGRTRKSRGSFLLG